jgi:hypothetical protein
MVQGHTNIEIGTIRAEEWNIFFLLAAGESWQLPQRGVKPFCEGFADNAFSLRSFEDSCGFITALYHVNYD